MSLFARCSAGLFCWLWLAALPPALSPALAGEPAAGLALHQPGRYDLTPSLEILASPAGGLSLAQVTAPPWRGRFSPVRQAALHLASTELREHWLRLTLATLPGSPAARASWLVATDYVFLGQIDFYRPTPAGWEMVAAGLYRPFANREVTYRSGAFLLPRLDQGPVTCYLRLETRGLNPIHFQLWSLPAFLTHMAKEDYLYGVCFGVLGCMILFNLFIAVSLRDRVYFSYVGYIFFALVSLTLLHGQLQTLLDLGDQGFTRVFWTSMGLFTSFAYLFMRGVLNAERLGPLMGRLLWFGFYYGLALVAAGLFSLPWLGRWLALGSGIFSPWLALGAGVVSWRRGFVAARYFLVAWGVLAVAVAVFALQEVGPLAGQYWARNALVLGTALESILLSLALAARIRGLQEEREVLRRSESRFRQLSHTDGLTGLYNKRYFSERLATALAAGGPAEGLCLLLLDIDDFKEFNDTFGHDQGDLVLQGLAQVMTDSVRAGDLPCRWGGEEFAVILAGVGWGQAAAVAERIRQRFAAREFPPAGGTARCTASLGLVQHRPGETAAELVRRADQALYQAKRAGKNRLAGSA
ncbi:MAG: sensor domain-containing diguanylate cyclase [Deltaproteobacteria bacterium]|nr:sensor domain-containing diguanylate cyclase [Deltaproteobacteria bacterium]